MPYVTDWAFKQHPGGREDPLWCVLDDPSNRISYRRFLDVFANATRRAGVNKPTTPTAFRKSNASWLARQGASSRLIEDRQGRSRGSRAVARYVARFGDAEGDRYAALHGLEVERDAPNMAPPSCPRCGESTPADKPACVWCGQPLDPVTSEIRQTVESGLLDLLATSDDPEERAEARGLFERLQSDPEAAADIVELARDHFGSTSSSSSPSSASSSP